MKNIILLFILFTTPISFAQWTDVGGGTNNSSHGLLEWNGKLVNLGSFNNPCNRVATWDGTQWECLDGGVGIVARAGCVWNGNLVVVGDFWNNFQPCPGCNGVAVWDGVQWTALDQGFNNDVLTCTVHNGELYIGGDFTQANGVPINRVAKWDDVAGQFVSVGNVTAMDNDVRCMVSYDGQLWVGGDFNNVDGCSPCDGLVKWDEVNQEWDGGNSGVDLIGGVNETVRVLYVNPGDGNLYMGGHFPELWDGDAPAQDFNMSGIAMYDGSNWYPLGTGLNEYCRAIHSYNGEVIAGGYFTDAGGTPAQKIAKWNPITQTWSAMGGGFDGTGIDEYVKSAWTWNGIFFAGGAYTQCEGGPMNYIAQWYEAPSNPPVANASASTTTICQGECINFTDLSTNSPTLWTWQFPGASTTTSSDQNPTGICWNNPGVYTITLDACNGFGCDQTSIIITVNETPSITVNNPTICEGESILLTASPTTAGGTYNWSTSENTQSISVNPSTSTAYTVDYTLNGCTSTLETSFVTVNPAPSLSVNDETICDGQSATLTATPSTGGGTYNWSTSETTNTISVSPSNTSNYTVDYTLNGCTSALITATVTVNPTYNVNENLAVCSGTLVTYPDGFSETVNANTSHTSLLNTSEGCDSVIITNVNVNPTYNTSENVDVCIGSVYTYPDGFSETINNSTAHTSSLSSVFGCDSIIITNVNAVSDYTLTENVSICSGDNYTYPDGTISTAIITDETHVSNLTSTNGCDSTITTNIIVTALPDNSVSMNGGVLTSNQNGASYQWLECPSMTPINGETGQNFTPTITGNYAVTVTLNGCANTSTCTEVTVVGLYEENLEIMIYPIPSTEFVVVSGPPSIDQEYYIIYDVQGKIVKQGQLLNSHQIDISSFKSGLYLIRFTTGHQAKILKE